jgi:hypothetical protein
MLFDADTPPDQRYPGWRQLGGELAELMQRTDKEAYYRKLAQVKALIEADMEFLKPSVQEPPEPEEPPEKVADMTHRGPGL